jgi:Ser/Thr protein kinase RdoA (MazF antagonist)
MDDLAQLSEPVAKLLARWGIPAGAAVELTEHGTNNRTLQVTAGDRRWFLRISQNQTSAQVQAEHRLLARLARAGLPFAVPAPVPLPAVALALSGAAKGPGWPRRAAAVARGGAWGERLTGAELAALPDLIVTRAVGSMLWLAGRWRRGQSSLAEVASRLDLLAGILRWRTAEGGELVHIVATAGTSPPAA